MSVRYVRMCVMFDTDALRLLDAVARTGSFTAAADRLGYT
ncbi:LysR family transcriptional regulator [Spongiactinospora sp. TRM90649]|nr:LysR family transcriptional regulator [Spongiactinospora sp. TRM90649]MDF5758357.1 LysR family transcriptional regulator [Spongiactinospora sp. TRM90649]